MDSQGLGLASKFCTELCGLRGGPQPALNRNVQPLHVELDVLAVLNS